MTGAAVSGRRALVLSVRPQTLAAVERLGIEATVVHTFADSERGRLRQVEGVTYLPVRDTRDVEEVTAAVMTAGVADRGLDFVHSEDEATLTTAAFLRRELGLTGMGPAQAVRFRDKTLQKQAVRDAGIAVPRCQRVPDPARADLEALEELTFPLVAKPASGAGTFNTSVVADRDGLARLLDDVARSARTAMVLEDFVPGAELHLDGIVADHRLQRLSVSRYTHTCLSIKEGVVLGSVVVDARDDAETCAQARALTEAVVAALSYAAGAFHLEAFEPEGPGGGLVFSECAARIGGALIAETIEHKYGFDLFTDSLTVAAGGDLPELPPGRREVVGWSFLPMRPGRLVRHLGTDALRRLDGVEYVRIERELGSVTRSLAHGTTERLGQVLLVADSFAEWQRRQDRLVAAFEDSLVIEDAPGEGQRLQTWLDLV